MVVMGEIVGVAEVEYLSQDNVLHGWACTSSDSCVTFWQ